MNPETFFAAGARHGAIAMEGPERMKGFAVLGVTFESGHTLALRHFEATSFGPGFTAVWMREPSGEWRFFSTNPPAQSCAKYMLPDVADQVAIDVRWVDDRTMHVSIGAISMRWFIEFEETRRTRWMSAIVSRVPRRALRTAPVSRAMAFVASKGLGAGSLRLRGRVPNGQRFAGMPSHVWNVRCSTAWTSTWNFGDVVRPGAEARFGDFWVPAAPIAVAGEVEFTPVRAPAARRLPLAA